MSPRGGPAGAVFSSLAGLALGLAGAVLAFALLGVAPGSATAQAAGEEPYVIGPGDVLSVTVWKREDLTGEIAVSPDGKIPVPLLGFVQAAGLTPESLGNDLTRRFSFVDRNVSQITVGVTAYRSRQVHVLGEVRLPGAYGFANVPGLWAVLRDAGGPLPTAALQRVRVVQGDGETVEVVDLRGALDRGELASLPALTAGATVYVPRAQIVPPVDAVHVYGAVGRPGSYSIEAASTLLEAVLAAGGPGANANMGSVRVIRPGGVQARVFEVDLEKYTHEGELFANLALHPGDTVTVPRGRSLTVLRAAREVVFGAGGFVLGVVALLADNGTTVRVESQQGQAGQ